MKSVLGFICGIIVFTYINGQTVEEGTRVHVTAAHLGDIPGYTKVYEDLDTDYALYVVDGYIATSIAEGDTVQVADTNGIVKTVSEKEFTVQVRNVSKIVPGVSGAPVYRDNTPIGFISGWNGDGAVRCVFY